MWTNLQFNSVPEEPFFSPERDTASRSRHKALNPHLSDLSFFGNVGAALSQQDTTASAAYERAKQQQAALAAATHAHSINDLLAWGIYPSNDTDQLFTAPPVAESVDNQILDPLLQNFGHEGRFESLAGPSLPPLTLRGAEAKAKQQQQQHSRPSQVTPAATTIDPATTTINPPPSKRAKIRRPPGGFGIAGDHNLQLEEEVDMSIEDETTPGLTDLSPSEDKRRRNTLASARFRLKKKEREVAMERRAKDLDDRVADLERECESLRKENQWLKSLVVGATTGEESVPPSQITSPANGVTESAGSAIGAALGGQGNVINIDELVRVLKAKGAVITSSTGASTSNLGHLTSVTTSPSNGLAPATGKRKRGAANST